jgi:hypothetical protein
MSQGLPVHLVRCYDHISHQIVKPSTPCLEKGEEAGTFHSHIRPVNHTQFQGKYLPKISVFSTTYKLSPFPSIILCKSSQSVSFSVRVVQ